MKSDPHGGAQSEPKQGFSFEYIAVRAGDPAFEVELGAARPSILKGGAFDFTVTIG
jgi:hypothetical protein